MKTVAVVLSTFFFAIQADAEDGIDPFPKATSDAQDSHAWKDVVITPTTLRKPGFFQFMSCSENKKYFIFRFFVDADEYESAIQHREANRGAVFMAGRLDSPDLCCWLRPFVVRKGEAVFFLLVSRKQLENAYAGFIPGSGATRYLLDLRAFAVQQLGREKVSSQKK